MKSQTKVKCALCRESELCIYVLLFDKHKTSNEKVKFNRDKNNLYK